MGTNIVSVSMDTELEERVEKYCKKKDIKKSPFICEAVREKLEVVEHEK